MRNRVMALMVAIMVLFVGMTARLLAVSRMSAFTVSAEYATRMQVVATAYGTIYDRYGEPLVNRTSVWRLSAAPQRHCVEVLKKETDIPLSVLSTMLAKGERLVWDLKEPISATSGICQFEIPKRYQQQPSACHVIGYINGDGVGVSGVEKVCYDTLSRYKGEAQVIYQTDALGRPVVDETETTTDTLARCKGGVTLTLDAQIQRIVENASFDIDRGAVVVLSADHADVLASASFPMYDQNAVGEVLDDPSSPLLDRTAINYNIGSVFKILVAAAALESGIEVTRTYDCNGLIDVNGTTFHCHNRLGDGKLTMKEAMAVSCNCYFIQLALDVGSEKILNMAKKAHLHEPLELMDEINTSRSILPSAFDLTADAALANFAIGQGQFMSTAYHMAALYKTIADDGVWEEPSLFLGEVDENGQLLTEKSPHTAVRLFSKKTARRLQSMLLEVVNNGTGKRARPSNGKAAGKTGTAQTGWKQNGQSVVQSWFVGYYPADKPQYVIAVMSENGGNNGQTAAPIFSYICDELFSAGLVEKAK